ncbi:MAG: hypothetical protein K6B64_05245 [Acholeplasmatales bacterium]|nr:hypothetical protein [Acholeplasmatales bacterium]
MELFDIKCFIYLFGTLSVFMIEYGIYRLVVYLHKDYLEKKQEVGLVLQKENTSGLNS